MDSNHLDFDFDKIKTLFQKYQKALQIYDTDNTALLTQLKDKITIQFWKTIQKAKSVSDEMKEHSDVIIKIIGNCIKTYPEKDPDEFCKLTYASIIKALKSKVDTENFASNTGGMYLSDNQNRLRKKINKAYKQFISFKTDNKQQFIQYAVDYLGFEKQDIEDYIFPKKSVSLYAPSSQDEDEEYCVADRYTDISKQQDYTLFLEEQQQLKILIENINEQWHNQKESAKPIMSELLTCKILSDIEKSNISVDFIKVIYNQDFICKEMIDSFLKDKEYVLPSIKEIGEKYNLQKSSASIKLTRFLENLKNK